MPSFAAMYACTHEEPENDVEVAFFGKARRRERDAVARQEVVVDDRDACMADRHSGNGVSVHLSRRAGLVNQTATHLRR